MDQTSPLFSALDFFNICKEMRDRDRLHRQAIRSRDSNSWNLYKSRRSTVNRLIRHSKRCYFGNLLENRNCNSRQFWQALMDSAVKRKTCSSATIPISAKDLNDKFASVVSSSEVYQL